MNEVSSYVAVGAVLVSALTLLARAGRALVLMRRLLRAWRVRRLRQVWGIRNGDRIRVVCSELPQVATVDSDTKRVVYSHHTRQFPEDRQFIYYAKYGDIDALIEVVTSLIVLYPDSEIRMASSAEQITSSVTGDYHLVVIGGPDYNEIAHAEIDSGRSRFEYVDQNGDDGADIVAAVRIVDRETGKYFSAARHSKYPMFDDDVGYFERYHSSEGSRFWTVLLGGPNTVGVTGAAKAFAAFRMDDATASNDALRNAAVIRGATRRATLFGLRRVRRLAVIFPVRKEHALVRCPSIDEDCVYIDMKSRRHARADSPPTEKQGEKTNA